MKISSFLVASIIALTSFSCAGNISKNAKDSADYYFQKSANSSSVKLEYEHFVLENGLNVYLSKNTETPRFRAEIAVHAGSKFDPSDATGIAHYLEHMLFKGSEDFGTLDYNKEKTFLDKVVELYDVRFKETDDKKRKELEKEINKLTIEASKYAVPNEISALYSKIGGKGLNAYTDSDETVYLVDLPKNRLEQWAKLESNRFEKPVFRLFQPELEIVYEEKNRSLDNKGRVIWDSLSNKLYKNHAYGTQTTLGTVEHLKNPSLTKMYEFYRKYYVPNNMAIIISGDLDLAETKKTIEKYFGKMKKKELPKYSPAKEDELKATDKETVYYKGEEKVMLAFRAVNKSDKDKDNLEFLSSLLDNNQAGLINLNLTEKQKVRSANAFTYIQDDYGAFYLSGTPKEGQTLEEVEKLLISQIDLLKKGDFDETVMKGIVLDYEKTKKALLESNEGRVAVMKDAFLANKTVEDVFNSDKRIKSLTKADIVKLANKYFSKNYAVVYRKDKETVFPKVEKPDIEKVKLNNNQKSDFIKSLEAMKPTPIQPKWVDYNKDFKVSSYAPGTVLYHAYNNINDFFNLSISYDYGKNHEKNLCGVMDELNFAGVDKMTAEQVKKEFFNMGVDFSYGCDNNSSSINISGLDENFEPALKLAEKIVWNAKLDQEHLSDSMSNILTSRKNAKKNVNTLMSALIEYVKHGDESGFKNRLKKEELDKLSIAEYDSLKNKLKKQNFTVYYTGQRSISEVEKTVKKYHSPEKIKVPLLNPRKEKPTTIIKRHDKPVKIYFLDFQGAQAHLNLIIPGGEVKPEESLINSFYNQYMSGGMGAVFFQEIREARSLAYSSYGNYYLGGRLGDQDEFEGYVGTQADKTIEAMKVFIDIMKNPPQSETHFQRAKEAVENNYRTGYKSFRNVVGFVESWAELGYDKDPRPEFFEKLDKITMKDFNDFVKEKISSKNMTFAIVGDKTKINMEELKKIAEVEEIKIDDIFTD